MITESQRKVFNFIIKYIDENRNSPSARNITEGAGLKSTSTVHGHIKRLEKSGYIKRTEEIARGIQIVK